MYPILSWKQNSMSNSNLEEEKTSQSVLWTSFSVKHIRWFRKFQSLFGKWKYIHSSKFEAQSHQSLPRKLHVRSRQPVKKEVRFPYLNIALLSNNQVFLNPLFVTLVFQSFKVFWISLIFSERIWKLCCTMREDLNIKWISWHRFHVP